MRSPISNMTSKQSVAVLLASLLISVHCQPLGALIRVSRTPKDLPDPEDDNEVLDDRSKASEDTLKPSDEALDGSAETKDLQDSGETTEETEVDTNNFENLTATSEDLQEPEETTDVPAAQENTLSNFLEDLHAYDDARKPSDEALDDSDETTDLQEYGEGRSHAVGLFMRQLLPLFSSAFFSAVTTVIFNWFFPFKVVPPPPGLVGVSQLWGGLPHPKHWHHHWGHLHQGPGKWGNGNWGQAYWGPAYSGHTPQAPPAQSHWEPHPHAHL